MPGLPPAVLVPILSVRPNDCVSAAGAHVNRCVNEHQAVARFEGTGTPFTYFFPVATSFSSSGAFSLRNVFSATHSNFQMRAQALSTRLKRFAALVRSRTEANGDSMMLVVRRCFQCYWG